MVGLLLVGRVTVERGQRLMLPLTLMTLLPLTLVPFAPSVPWALVPVFVSGIGTSFSMLARVAFVRGVDNAYRGRAFAIAAAGVTTPVRAWGSRSLAQQHRSSTRPYP